MQIGKGVEWAVHACALLAVAPPPGLSAEALARYHDVPPAYMAKQLQALSRAGIVQSSRGPQGGYSLTRPATEVSLWEITAAIEGTAPAFRCTEVRQNGPCGSSPEACKTPCPIAAAFLAAEDTYRASLKEVKLSDILHQVAAVSPPENMAATGNWIEGEQQKRR